MKYSELIKIEPLMVDGEGASVLLGRRSVFEDMVKAGWIRPIVDRHKAKLYKLDDLKSCARRLEQGDYPQ